MNCGRDVFIVEAVRTPMGRGKADGALHHVHPVDLLARTLNELVSRAKVDKAQVEDVVAGVVVPVGEQGANVARLAALQAGFPIEVPGLQIQRFCGSSQQAVHSVTQMIAAGDAEMGIACGVESMSRVPMGSDANFTPEFVAHFPYAIMHQGQSAEMLAEKYHLSRAQLDEFAVRSHTLAAAARNACFTSREVFQVESLQYDEGIRDNPDPAKMASLKTVFKADGVITAGNSSQISDGAAAVLLASGEKAAELGLRKRARVITRVAVGSDPVLMLDGPIAATRKALARAGLTIHDIDAFEINEAFASVPLAWAAELQPDMNRLNMQGGAIAHGHPLGATGAALMTKLVNILERTGGRYGLQAMCIGFGMATATIIERGV
jgi:acetyl-CoA acyltransferase